MVKKRKALIAILVSLLLLLSLTVSLTPIISKAAAAATVSFSFDISGKQALTKTPSYQYRNATSVSNAWAVRLDYSNEPTVAHPDGSGKTATTFWLGIYNPKGTNPLGSKKYNVTEGGAYFDYFPAYEAASKKYVYLYACDNNYRLESYSASGKWNPATGKTPNN